MSDAVERLRALAQQMRREAALWPKTERAQQTARLLLSYAGHVEASIDALERPQVNGFAPRLEQLVESLEVCARDNRASGARYGKMPAVPADIIKRLLAKVDATADALTAALREAEPPQNRQSNNCSSGEHAHCSGIFKTANEDNLDDTWTCACPCHVVNDEETPCPKRDDQQHCNCWYDSKACCACGDNPATVAGRMAGEATGAQPEPQSMADAAEMPWVVLANVSGGNWTLQSQEWQDAAQPEPQCTGPFSGASITSKPSRERPQADAFDCPVHDPRKREADTRVQPAAPRESAHRIFASKLLNIVLGDLEWVRAQGGRASVCPLCHAVCERDNGPGHQDDCPRIAIAMEFDRLYPPPAPLPASAPETPHD